MSLWIKEKERGTVRVPYKTERLRYQTIKQNYIMTHESFDLSKTHSLSTQNLVKFFIDWLIDSWFIYNDDHWRVHQIQNYALYWGNKIPTTMYGIPKISEKWVEYEYEKIERLGIVPGTWSAKQVGCQNLKVVFTWDIIYC